MLGAVSPVERHAVPVPSHRRANVVLLRLDALPQGVVDDLQPVVGLFLPIVLGVQARQSPTALAGAPYYIAPTSTKVVFGSEMAKFALDAGSMDVFVRTDWAKINPRRAEYIDRFNRLVQR